MGLLKGRFFSRARPSKHETMVAVTYERPGPAAEVLRLDRAHPKPDAVGGQALVKVAGAGVNPVDIKFRSHPVQSAFLPKPKIPGGDVSGTVVSAPANSGLKPGDAVFGLMPLILTPWGACAEFAAVDASLLALAPVGRGHNHDDLVRCAGFPLVGCTVVQALRPVVKCLGETRGKRVLIQAGAGGVGSFAIQYCKNHLHMHVTTTCSTRNVGFVKSLGADVAIDYTTHAFEDELAEPVDVVLDAMPFMYEARTLRSSRVLKPKGSHYVHIAASPHLPVDRDPLGLAIPEARVERIVGKTLGRWLHNLNPWQSATYHGPVFVHPDGPTMCEVARCVREGEVRGVVSDVLSLSDVAEAHRRVEEGHVRGKLVLRVEGGFGNANNNDDDAGPACVPASE